MNFLGFIGGISRNAISPVCGLDSEFLSGKRKPALNAVFDGTVHLGGLTGLTGVVIMVQRCEIFKPLASVNVYPRPSVCFPDGRRFFSSRDLAGHFHINHADFLALLRRWREWLPGSMRNLIDFEDSDTLISEEVLCG